MCPLRAMRLIFLINATDDVTKQVLSSLNSEIVCLQHRISCMLVGDCSCPLLPYNIIIIISLAPKLP